MASFNTFYDKLLIHEGGYVNNPNDKGGETYKGISRKNFPLASIWKILDKIPNKKTGQMFPKLDTEIRLFYKLNFWDILRADHINNQSIANILVDFKINGGLKMDKIKYFLKLDAKKGIVDTVRAINTADQKQLFDFIYNERQMYYGKISKNKGQGVFKEGWDNRLKDFVFSETGILSILVIVFLFSLSIYLVKTSS